MRGRVCDGGWVGAGSHRPSWSAAEPELRAAGSRGDARPLPAAEPSAEPAHASAPFSTASNARPASGLPHASRPPPCEMPAEPRAGLGPVGCHRSAREHSRVVPVPPLETSRALLERSLGTAPAVLLRESRSAAYHFAGGLVCRVSAGLMRVMKPMAATRGVFTRYACRARAQEERPALRALRGGLVRGRLAQRPSSLHIRPRRNCASRAALLSLKCAG